MKLNFSLFGHDHYHCASETSSRLTEKSTLFNSKFAHFDGANKMLKTRQYTDGNIQFMLSWVFDFIHTTN
jgi:hypothetical protein